MSIKTVLILDDNEAVREGLAGFFEDKDWRVLREETAEKAIEILERETPDGAVVDIRLPNMDGNNFLRIVSKKYPSLACVLITGSPEYFMPDDLSEFEQVESQVFSKPLTDLAELEKALLGRIEKCRTD